MQFDPASVWVTNPLERQLDQLAEAADLLEASRPDLAGACREAAETLREETELAVWTSQPEPVGTAG